MSTVTEAVAGRKFRRRMLYVAFPAKIKQFFMRGTRIPLPSVVDVAFIANYFAIPVPAAMDLLRLGCINYTETPSGRLVVTDQDLRESLTYEPMVTGVIGYYQLLRAGYSREAGLLRIDLQALALELETRAQERCLMKNRWKRAYFFGEPLPEEYFVRRKVKKRTRW